MSEDVFAWRGLCISSVLTVHVSCIFFYFRYFWKNALCNCCILWVSSLSAFVWISANILTLSQRVRNVENVISTSMQRHDVASLLMQRCLSIPCPLGCFCQGFCNRYARRGYFSGFVQFRCMYKENNFCMAELLWINAFCKAFIDIGSELSTY